MSFTKVAPAGIGTSPGTSIRIGDSLLHSTGLDIGTGSGIGVTIRQHGNATFTGIVTASSFSGDITGKATELATNATGTNLTLSGNLGVGGVVTYEDVTNVDSVGIVTARAGVNLVGNDLNVGSNIKIGNASGIVTATSFTGSGANLTSLPAGNLTGTVADARISSLTASKLSGALPAISGANLTNLDASDFASGTIPDARFPAVLPSVSGVNLTGVSGFSTALGNTQGTLENLIFKTTEAFTIGSGTSIRIESDNMSGNTAFTRLSRINVATGATFHVSAGTTFIMNVLSVF